MSNDPYDDPYASPEEQGARAQDASVESDRLGDVDAPTDAGPAPAPAPTPEPAPAPSASPQFEMPAAPSTFQEPTPRGPEPVAPYASGYADPMNQPLQAYGEAPGPMPQPYAPQPGYNPNALPPYGYAAQPGPYGAMVPSTKSKATAGVLAILLGTLGIHNFYLGYTGKGIAQLLITVLSFGILAFVSSIWGVIEGIVILGATPGSPSSRDAQGRVLQ